MAYVKDFITFVNENLESHTPDSNILSTLKKALDQQDTFMGFEDVDYEIEGSTIIFSMSHNASDEVDVMGPYEERTRVYVDYWITITLSYHSPEELEKQEDKDFADLFDRAMITPDISTAIQHNLLKGFTLDGEATYTLKDADIETEYSANSEYFSIEDLQLPDDYNGDMLAKAMTMVINEDYLGNLHMPEDQLQALVPRYDYEGEDDEE